MTSNLQNIIKELNSENRIIFKTMRFTEHFYFTDYYIFENGLIWSKKRARFLKPGISNGYKMLMLSKNKVVKNKSVARWVLESFTGEIPVGKECAHNDGNKRNDHISNLRWATSQENQNDKIKHGTTNKWEKHPMVKITKEMASYIKANYVKTKYHKTNAGELAKKFGIDRSQVLNIVSGRSWKGI